MPDQTHDELCDCTGKCGKCDGTGTNPHLNSADPKCAHCSGTGVCYGTSGGVRIRDPRPISQQILSGLGLAGLLVVGFVAFFCLEGSVGVLAGHAPEITRPVHRILAGAVLLIISIMLFITASHWAKGCWVVLGYMSSNCVRGLIMGVVPYSRDIHSPPVRIARPVVLAEMLVLAFASVVCYRYWKHSPSTAEKAGLVGLVVAVACSLTWDSSLPLLAGATVLGLIQLVNRQLYLRQLRLKHVHPMRLH